MSKSPAYIYDLARAKKIFHEIRAVTPRSQVAMGDVVDGPAAKKRCPAMSPRPAEAEQCRVASARHTYASCRHVPFLTVITAAWPPRAKCPL